MGFEKALEKKVLICCGSGGVGKTTLSAALGVYAANLGKSVLVLTIDPAKRLANSLGLENLEGDEVEVAPGKFKGRLFAAVLDMKKTFDEFIVRLASSEEGAEKVLNNNIYQQLSTALSGSQEYTALERLLLAVTSEKYDLVILDTPPTKHAIDFLNAPVKIHSLFQETVIRWFLMPFSTLDKFSLGLMNRGTKAALKGFEKLGGSEFFTSVLEFFSSIKDWQKDLRERAAEVHRLLTSSHTGFVLVTGFNSVRIEEARYFERSLKRGGYLLSAIIVNRAFPLWGEINSQGDVDRLNEEDKENYHKLYEYYNILKEYYSNQQHAFSQFAGELRNQVLFVRLPDFNQDIHDIQGLSHIADRLKEASEDK